MYIGCQPTTTVVEEILSGDQGWAQLMCVEGGALFDAYLHRCDAIPNEVPANAPTWTKACSMLKRFGRSGLNMVSVFEGVLRFYEQALLQASFWGLNDAYKEV